VKRIGKIVSGLLAVIVVLAVAEIIASESAEVVELETRDDAGAAVVTRLWVVEFDGVPVIRSGAGASGWYARLVARPRVRFTRNGQTLERLAVPAPALRDEINGLMRAKYGWRDHYISTLFGGRDDAIPVRLEPLP